MMVNAEETPSAFTQALPVRHVHSLFTFSKGVAAPTRVRMTVDSPLPYTTASWGTGARKPMPCPELPRASRLTKRSVWREREEDTVTSSTLQEPSSGPTMSEASGPSSGPAVCRQRISPSKPRDRNLEGPRAPSLCYFGGMWADAEQLGLRSDMLGQQPTSLLKPVSGASLIITIASCPAMAYLESRDTLCADRHPQ